MCLIMTFHFAIVTMCELHQLDCDNCYNYIIFVMCMHTIYRPYVYALICMCMCEHVCTRTCETCILLCTFCPPTGALVL